MRALAQDARYALRMFGREKGITAVAVLTLALGIGANTALFSLVNAVLLRPLPYAASDRVVQVLQVFDRSGEPADARSETVVRELFDLWRQSGRTLDGIAAFGTRSLTLNGPADAVRLRAGTIDPAAFDIFAVRPLLGRLFERDDARAGGGRVVLLSERLWRSRFGGDPAVVGRSCTIDDVPHAIAGVLPDSFSFPDRTAELWLPFVPLTPPKPVPGTRFVDGFSVVARVKTGVPLAAAQAEGTAMARQVQTTLGGYVFRQEEGPTAVRLVPLHSWIANRVRPALVVLFGAVALVLLIGAANLAHVLLARGVARRREIGIRTAVGASRARLVRQLLTESVLLTLAGGVAGLAVARGLQLALPAIAPLTIPRLDEVSLDPRVLGFSLVVSAAVGILAGALPALHGSRADVRSTIGSGNAAESGFRLRRNLSRGILVAGELAVTLVLLVGAALLLESFVRIVTIDPGYDPSHVVTVQVTLPSTRYPGDAPRSAFIERLLARASSLPGIDAAGITRSLPLTPNRSNVGFSIESDAAPAQSSTRLSADLRVVSPGFFPAMGVRLADGRFFSEDDRTGSPRVAMVNQAFVRRYLAPASGLGVKIRFARQEPAEIVGVVADIRHAALTDDPVPEIYAPQRQTAAASGALTLAVRTDGDSRAVLASLGAIVREIDPGLPVDAAMTMASRVSASVSEPRFYLLMVGLFALLALSMALVGSYGVIAYGVSQRRREIGVRMALGAGSRDIVMLVLGQAACLTSIGIGCGSIAAWVVTRVLRRFLFEVSPSDPAAFILAALLLGLAGLAAAYLPARRAAALEPRDALS